MYSISEMAGSLGLGAMTQFAKQSVGLAKEGKSQSDENMFSHFF